MRHAFAVLAIAAVPVSLIVLQAGGSEPSQSPDSARKSSSRFWGVDPVRQPTARQLDRLSRGRVDTIRYPLYWSHVEPERGVANWTEFDQVVARAARRNIDVLPFFYSTPSWVAGDIRTLPVRTERQRRGWAKFLKRAANRYGPGGSFWEARPDLRRLPITTWQIWNEQNYFYFAKPVSPRRYAALVKLSSRALKAVNPRATVLLGGMFGWPAANPPKALTAVNFLRKMYAVRGVRGRFDAVALHPYAPAARYVKPQVVGLREVMRNFRDGRKGLWITEMTWASTRPGTPFGKGRRGQARELGRAFAVLRRNRSNWRLKRVFWFSVTDDHGPDACAFCGGSGLFTSKFRAKPSWHRYVDFSGGRP